MFLILLLAVPYGFLFFRQPLYSDALSYYAMSLDILHSRPTDYFWPLGWPLVMAGVQYVLGESQQVVKALSFALALFTLWLQLVIVRKALPHQASPRRRWVAYGIVVLNSLYLLYHANFTFTAVPMAFLGTLLVYALLLGNRARSTFCATMLSALAAVVRFGSILLLPATLIYSRLVRKTRWWLLVSFAGLSILPVLAAVAYASLSLGGLVALNTANSMNLFYGNHKLTPLYETWRWGSHASPEKDSAISALVEKYRLVDGGSLQYYDAMRREAFDQIARKPLYFVVRSLTRASVLLAFDSSIGASQVESGRRVVGFFLLVMMLLVSLVTKTAATAGVLGSRWTGRHLVWIMLLTLCLPHILAFAHPSYFQMFMTMVVPVAAVAAARAEPTILKERLPHLAVSALLVLISHLAFVYHMWRTRF